MKSSPCYSEECSHVCFVPPLYIQRQHKVRSLLRQHHCTSFIDAGCSSGELLGLVLAAQLIDDAFEYVEAIDVSAQSLEEVKKYIPQPCGSLCSYLRPLEVKLMLADLTIPPPSTAFWNDEQHDSAPLGFSPSHSSPPKIDAVISIEVLEHIFPDRVAAYTDTLFAALGAARGAKILILSTPNRDMNCLFKRDVGGRSDGKESEGDTMKGTNCAASLSPRRSIYCPAQQQPRRRHPGHLFELTVAQFAAYCDYIIQFFSPYWERYDLITSIGSNFTQMVVFYAASESVQSRGDDEMFRYTRSERLDGFPFEKVFGMGLGDYLQECGPLQSCSLPHQDEAAGEDRAEVSRHMGGYTCVYRTIVEHETLWLRLCSALSKALSQQVLCMSRQREQQQQQRLPRGRGGGSKTAPLHVTLQALLQGTQRATALGPLFCSVPAFTACLQEQLQLWRDAYKRDVGRWVRFARRVKIPFQCAFTDSVVPEQEKTRCWADELTMMRCAEDASWREQLALLTRDRRTEAECLASALRVSQGGMLVQEWIQWHVKEAMEVLEAALRSRSKAVVKQSARNSLEAHRPAKACGAAFTSATGRRAAEDMMDISDGDNVEGEEPVRCCPYTGCGLFLNDDIPLVLLFMVAVDVLPGVQERLVKAAQRYLRPQRVGEARYACSRHHDQGKQRSSTKPCTEGCVVTPLASFLGNFECDLRPFLF